MGKMAHILYLTCCYLNTLQEHHVFVEASTLDWLDLSADISRSVPEIYGWKISFC